MSRILITKKIVRSVNRFGLKLRKHSPEMLMAVGIGGAVTSAVMACRATTKLGDILDDSKNDLEQIQKYSENLDAPELHGLYTKEDAKKDTVIVYVQSGIKIAKLYAPSVVFGALSIGSILASHNILHKRNVALAAAYTGVNNAFKDYRGRVVERFGDKLDKELLYNIKAKEIEKTITNADGTETATKEIIDVAYPSRYSEYARFFDEGCVGWEKDPELNLMTVRRIQDWANERLQTKGHLFLNEVYDMFNIPRTKKGNIVGWIYDENNPIGDNYVDFGIYDIACEATRNFVNGYERVLLMDFNVDGPILDLI